MKDITTVIKNITFGFFMAFAMPAVLFYTITVDSKKFPNKFGAISGIGLIAVATIILGYLTHMITGISNTTTNWAVYLSICVGFAMSNNLTDEDLFADNKTS